MHNNMSYFKAVDQLIKEQKTMLLKTFKYFTHLFNNGARDYNIVTYWPIARQRLDKHIRAKTDSW
jgi:hypothetical protein